MIDLFLVSGAVVVILAMVVLVIGIFIDDYNLSHWDRK